MDIANSDALWASYPSRNGRNRFVLALTAHFPSDQVESKVVLARDVVKPRLDPAYAVFRPEWELATGVVSSGWNAEQDRQLRAEILYGLLGTHPEFFDHLSYLDFVARRRYRIVTRMTRFVDPELVFDQPDGASVADYQLNPASAGYWVRNNGRYPFVLTAQGRAHPREAIERLFTVYPDELEHRNKLGCEAVAVAVHLDSLLASKSPDQLLAAMVLRGNDYLRIDHPVGSVTYSPNGAPVIVGAITVARDAPQGDVSLRIEFEVENLLDTFVQRANPVRTVAGHGAKVLDVGWRTPPPNNNVLQLLRLRIEDGIAPPASAPQNNVVTITGIYVDPATLAAGDVLDAGTRYTGWLEVQLLPRDVFAGTRLTPTDAPQPHFITDPRKNIALFERVFLSRDELIPGDHVVLPNHPLYRSILVGAWQAEHSFVTRVFADGGLQTSGHGLSGKLTKVADDLIEEINEHLALIAEVTRRHVEHIGEAGVESYCQDVAGREVACTSPRAAVSLPHAKFLYFPFRYHERAGEPNTIREIVHGTGEVVNYILPDEEGLFLIESDSTHPVAKRDAVTVVHRQDVPAAFAFWYEGQLQIVIRLPNDSDDLPNWKLAFSDPRFVLNRHHQLFAHDMPGIDDAFVQWVGYRDLQGLFPIYNDASINSIAVIRPRVDFSPAYQPALQQVGAL